MGAAAVAATGYSKVAFTAIDKTAAAIFIGTTREACNVPTKWLRSIVSSLPLCGPVEIRDRLPLVEDRRIGLVPHWGFKCRAAGPSGFGAHLLRLRVLTFRRTAGCSGCRRRASHQVDCRPRTYFGRGVGRSTATPLAQIEATVAAAATPVTVADPPAVPAISLSVWADGQSYEGAGT
ncbi:hypothetical protein EJ06DRAFT_64952 [Trichodelitschia bisporula]|uniref:Uncharacterized protein n=1 Tax=Trichodelitschia bisporula TaxID=703511 RepID=A0A6G1HSV4_9PEZI|nr:hypothetical protein EJ06DRAFT_64952 [Trichodelitschia bisporula]